MRTALFILALAATPLANPAWAAQSVALRAAPIDRDGTITLGDLFENAGAAASVVVAPGAKAGGSVVLDAGRVQSAARAAGLAWPNPSGMRRVVVRGASDAGAGAGPLVVSAGAQAEVLVYARSLRAGEVISAEDLTWAPVVGRAPLDAPSDADALIGLAAKKPLRAGSPAAVRDLATARVINKDESVTVQFRTGGVALTLQGKALTGAAAGETLRVLNPQSKMIIDAVAVGPGVAVVGRDAAGLKPARLAARP